MKLSKVPKTHRLNKFETKLMHALQLLIAQLPVLPEPIPRPEAK